MTRLFLVAALVLTAVPPLNAQEPAADTGRVYAISEVTGRPRATNAPELIQALQASYPVEAAGRSGQVEVAVVIGPDGTVADARVVSSTDPVFDPASVSAVRVLRFTPASMDGRPVAVRVNLPIRWEPAPPEPESEPAPAPADAPLAESPDAAEEDTVLTYEMSAVTERPRPRNTAVLLRELERRYPPHLRDARREGIVQARFRVNADGSVSRIRITRASRHDFAAPTVEALQVLRFHPARLNGRPVAVWVELPIQWTVSDPPLPNPPTNLGRP
jgi:TonB family protein